MDLAPRTIKSGFVLLATAFALLTANRASGDTGGTSGTGAGGVTGTSALAASDFTYYLEAFDGKNWVQMNSTDQLYFMNRARCECDADKHDYTGSFKFVIVPAATTPTKITGNLAISGGLGEGRIYAGGSGVNCLDIPATGVNPANSCTNLLDPTGYAAEIPGGMAYFEGPPRYESPPIPVAWLFGSATAPVCNANGISCDSTDTCSTFTGSITIYFWARTTANNYADTHDLQYSVKLQGAVPYTPASVTAEAGNEALTVRWEWPSGQKPAADNNFRGVQIFCQRGENNQVFHDDVFRPSYKTSAALCPAYAPAASSYGGFSQLDKKYLCSDLIPSTASSHRITGLENGIFYGVGVAAVDRYGNISPISNIVWEKPIPTVDFYAEYKSAGGSAQGGFCSLASHHARPGILTLAGIVALGLVLRRRGRLKKRPACTGAIAMLIAGTTLTAGQAQAQPVYHDSSFVEDRVSEAWGGSPREYAIEARFGLYTPNVDSEFSGATAQQPLKNVFGTKRRPMWQLEFDWEFLQAFGTLSIGGAIGYYKENAQACKQTGWQPADGTCPPTPDPENPDPLLGRSGDNTGLRLIPLAVLLVYRMDEAAEHWHIPFVPYAKIGLNYTIWTITNGNGDVAWFTDSKGHLTKGQGGTMGWQAAVGLSLRLDFLDPGAARGFDADAGVNHSYAFFELAHVDGSGLYRKDVLRVGDNTWFAGLMFEF